MDALPETESWIKTHEEMYLQITDRIAIDHEIQKMLKDILENPKK